MLHNSGSQVRSLIAYRSVPFSSIGCVCNTNAHLLALSLPILSQNCEYASIKSGTHFLLIFLAL